MKFITIDALRKQETVVDVPTVDDAMLIVRLRPGAIDMGVVTRDRETGEGISIVVGEYSALDPNLPTFSFGGTRTYHGNAVLYAFDIEGVTIGMPDDRPAIVWGE